MTETLGQRIRRHRKKRSLSQTDLGDLVGVTISWISQIEQDKATPSAALLNNIAATFHIPIRELLQDEDQHMDTVAKFKLAEVLLETYQPHEALNILYQLQLNPELCEIDKMKNVVYISECYYQLRQYDKTFSLLLPLIDSLEKGNFYDVYWLAYVRNLLGSCYFQTMDFTNAHYNYRKAFDLATRFSEFGLLSARISYNVALSLLKFENFSEALYFLNKASDFYKDCNDLRKFADALIHQGVAYQHLKMNEHAVEMFDQAKSLLQTLGLQSLSVMVEHTIATEVLFHQDPRLALEKLLNCLPLLDSESDYKRKILVHSKTALIYIRIEDFENANNHLYEAHILIEEHNASHTAEAAVCLQTLASLRLHLQEYDLAIEYSSKSSLLFGTMGLKKDQVNSLQIGIESYYKKGDVETAFALSQKCNDLLMNKQNEVCNEKNPSSGVMR